MAPRGAESVGTYADGLTAGRPAVTRHTHGEGTVRRADESGTFLFAINHTAADAEVPLDGPGTELLTGGRAAGCLAVPAGAVRVVRLDG